MSGPAASTAHLPAVGTGWLPCAPWRLSGLVLGPSMNDPASLGALGDAVNEPPYKAPPRAPVLFIKPRNTLCGPGGDRSFCWPDGVAEVEIGVHVGLVIGRTASRVGEAEAAAHVAALLLVADLSVPHASFYRPSLRLKALDGSCLLGDAVVVADVPPSFRFEVHIDGRVEQQASTATFLRPPARLIADVSAFMTLRAGDVLLLGAAHGAPRLHAGQQVRITAPGLPELAFEVRR